MNKLFNLDGSDKIMISLISIMFGLMYVLLARDYGLINHRLNVTICILLASMLWNYILK